LSYSPKFPPILQRVFWDASGSYHGRFSINTLI